MRPLADKTNVQAPDSDYPFGRIKDNPGNGTGTPVNEEVYGDIHQFFEKLISEAEVTPNELPDNDYSGFQLYEALKGQQWKNITLVAPWAAGAAVPQYKVVHGIVYLRGLLDAGSATNENVNSGGSPLPLPDVAVRLFCHENITSAPVIYRLDIDTAGQMKMLDYSAANTANHIVSLDGLYYHIAP